MIRRPQKPPSESISDKDLKRLMDIYGHVWGSPKLDGYRCVTENAAYTSAMKLVTNKFIQDILKSSKYNGLDGELAVGKPNHPDVFNRTTGPVRRAKGQPDFKLYVYDLHDKPGLTIEEKYYVLGRAYANLPYVHIVKQTPLFTVAEVRAFELRCVNSGYEGAIIRFPGKKYKDGRCTLREANIFKRKPVEDDECVIVGFVEQMKNLNKAVRSETGNMVRSSHKGNKVGKGTLGKFLVKSPKWKNDFAIGTGKGLTDVLRQKIWDNQEAYLGQTLVYKYQLYGSIDAPRSPRYKGFRYPEDITEY